MRSSDIITAALASAELVKNGDYNPALHKALIKTLAEQLHASDQLVNTYERSIRQLARSEQFSLHGRVFKLVGEEPEAPTLPEEPPSKRLKEMRARRDALTPGREKISARRSGAGFEQYLEEKQSEQLRTKRAQFMQLQKEVVAEIRQLRVQFNEEGARDS